VIAQVYRASDNEAMTEDEWMECTWPQTMVEFLLPKASHRKLRLFACRWARLNWTIEGTTRRQHAVEIAELYADRQASQEDLLAAYRGVQSTYEMPGGASAAAAFTCLDIPDVPMTPESKKAFIIRTVVMGALAGGSWTQDLRRCALLRDIFGNPFRVTTFDAACYAAKRIALAQSIYDHRTFEHLPLLANALENAGCDQLELWITAVPTASTFAAAGPSI
jgi:hypothetical protein